MNTAGKHDFRACALSSGLVLREDLASAEDHLRVDTSAESSAPDATDRRLADELVERGHLNRWQADQLLAGRTRFQLGPYRILDSIGQGGMGQVFKAEHTMMDRVVAIKVLPKERSTPEAISRFRLEIRAQAQLDHENLVRALDAGHDGNVHFLVTEFVPGTDLRRLVRAGGRLDMQHAASIVYQAARGLEHAHEKGMLHRDVKPGNILVTPQGYAKVSDLGLVGFFDKSSRSEFDGSTIIGTADFVAPEQVGSRQPLTAAADIYGLGCTLYYAVTGKVPFPGGTAREKARAHLSSQPLDPRRLNPNLSASFVDVIAEMLTKDPKRRIATAAEVMRRLEPWVAASIIAPGAVVLQPAVPRPPPLPMGGEFEAAANPNLVTPDSKSAETAGAARGWGARSPSDAATEPVAAELEDTLPMFERRDLVRRGWGLFGLPPALSWLVLAAMGIFLAIVAAIVLQALTPP